MLSVYYHAFTTISLSLCPSLSLSLFFSLSPSFSPPLPSPPSRSSQSEEVDERSVKLIMDLLKLSKSDGDSQVWRKLDRSQLLDDDLTTGMYYMQLFE